MKLKGSPAFQLNALVLIKMKANKEQSITRKITCSLRISSSLWPNHHDFSFLQFQLLTSIIYHQLSIINCQRFFRAYLHTTLGIQLKYKQEVDGKLPFLDTLLHCKNDGSLDISIYRKPTHTDQYLNFSSHHPCHVKEGVVSCLFHRAQTITQGKNIHWRGLPQRSTGRERISWGLCKDGQQAPHSKRASRGAWATAFFPYVAGLSEDVRRVLMQKIQHLNSLPIGIHPPRSADKSQGPRHTGEVGSCVPDPLQLLPCVYRGDEESSRDPHKGTQSHHQTGRQRSQP